MFVTQEEYAKSFRELKLVKPRVCGSRIMKIEQNLTKQQHRDSHESGDDESVNNNNIIIRL